LIIGTLWLRRGISHRDDVPLITGRLDIEANHRQFGTYPGSPRS
jgi:hypothetical protein